MTSSENIIKQIGYEPHEFLDDSKFWSKNIHPADAPHVFKELSGLFDIDYHSHEYRFKQKNGNYKWMHDEMRLIRDNEGNPVEIVGYWADITDRKLYEELLEEKYRAVLEANPDPVVVYDSEGKVEYFNPDFTRVFGWSLEERIGKKLDDFVPGENWPETRMMIDKVRAGEGFSGIRSYRFNKDGVKIPVSISGYSSRDQAGNIAAIIVNLQDITQLKQAEEQRDKLIADLQKALSEVKTLRGFLPICSHCKKIRDDNGYWNQIESYIHKHSDAEFSHGVCPECAKKYYPDMNLYGDEQTQG